MIQGAFRGTIWLVTVMRGRSWDRASDIGRKWGGRTRLIRTARTQGASRCSSNIGLLHVTQCQLAKARDPNRRHDDLNLRAHRHFRCTAPFATRSCSLGASGTWRGLIFYSGRAETCVTVMDGRGCAQAFLRGTAKGAGCDQAFLQAGRWTFWWILMDLSSTDRLTSPDP